MPILISAEQLRDMRGAAQVVDASAHLPAAERNAAHEFAEEHIPGAQFLDLASWFDETSPTPKAMPRADQIAERLAKLGIDPAKPIVLYDDSALRSACRAFFILSQAACENVAILDGGLAAWRAGGFPLDNGPLDNGKNHDGVQPLPTMRAASAVRTMGELLANIVTGIEQVVDARDMARFEGAADTVHGLPGGHIPGARNLFYRDLLTDDGLFRPPAELAAAFAKAGVDPARPLVASCGSGMTASVVLFAHRLLGYDHGALYDGSWAEWGSDPATPKQIGAAA